MTANSTPACADSLEPLLVSAEDAARLCGVARSTWLAMHSAGKIPLPRSLGRRRLWSLEELREWVRCGTPSREAWETMRAMNS